MTKYRVSKEIVGVRDLSGKLRFGHYIEKRQFFFWWKPVDYWFSSKEHAELEVQELNRRQLETSFDTLQ